MPWCAMSLDARLAVWVASHRYPPLNGVVWLGTIDKVGAVWVVLAPLNEAVRLTKAHRFAHAAVSAAAPAGPAKSARVRRNPPSRVPTAAQLAHESR